MAFGNEGAPQPDVSHNGTWGTGGFISAIGALGGQFPPPSQHHDRAQLESDLLPSDETGPSPLVRYLAPSKRRSVTRLGRVTLGSQSSGGNWSRVGFGPADARLGRLESGVQTIGEMAAKHLREEKNQI